MTLLSRPNLDLGEQPREKKCSNQRKTEACFPLHIPSLSHLAEGATLLLDKT